MEERAAKQAGYRNIKKHRQLTVTFQRSNKGEKGISVLPEVQSEINEIDSGNRRGFTEKLAPNVRLQFTN